MPKTENRNEYLFFNNYKNKWLIFINMVNITEPVNNTTSAKSMNLNKRSRHYLSLNKKKIYLTLELKKRNLHNLYSSKVGSLYVIW